MIEWEARVGECGFQLFEEVGYYNRRKIYISTYS
jgi:hypothetical protein